MSTDEEGHDYTIHNDHGVVVTRTPKHLDDAGMARLWTAIYEDPSWTVGMDEIVDFRGTDMSAVTAQGINLVAEISARAMAGSEREPKTAVIVDQDVTYGLVRMYEAFALDSPETIGIFHDAAEALAWIGGPAGLLD